MSFVLQPDQCSYLAEAFGAMVKGRRLDGSPISITLTAHEGQLTALAVPDLPRVTALQVALPGVEGEGIAALEGQRFVDICRRVSDPLTVVEDDGVVSLGHWKTPALTASVCPQIDDDFTRGSRAEFLRGLAAVNWAVSKDVIRPRLTMARFERGFVRACDGTRYCECRVEFGASWDVSGFLIPTLRRYFEHGGEEILLKQNRQHQMYRSGAVTLYCPRPSAEYLDLDSVVAEPARAHNNFILRVDRQALVAALKDAAIMAGSTQVVTMTLSTTELLVTARDGEHRAEVQIPCHWTGDGRVLNFFVAPLLQLLRMSTSERVELRLGTSTLKQQTPIVLWEDGIFALVNQARSGA